MNRRRLGRRKKARGEGERRKETRGGVACQIWTCSTAYCTLWTLTCTPGLQGSNSFKDAIFKLQNYYPSKKEKNVISKWLTYPESTFWCAQSNMRKQFVQIWQATPPLLEWGAHSSHGRSPQNRNPTNKSYLRRRLVVHNVLQDWMALQVQSSCPVNSSNKPNIFVLLCSSLGVSSVVKSELLRDFIKINKNDYKGSWSWSI